MAMGCRANRSGAASDARRRRKTLKLFVERVLVDCHSSGGLPYHRERQTSLGERRRLNELPMAQAVLADPVHTDAPRVDTIPRSDPGNESSLDPKTMTAPISPGYCLDGARIRPAHGPRGRP